MFSPLFRSIVEPDILLFSQTLNDATATKLAGENPDYATQSLFETIEAGKFPSWTVYIVSICPSAVVKPDH